MKLRIALGLLLSALSVLWAAAQVPAGGEFQVNTYTTGDQHMGSVASDATGNFVVAWSGQPDGGTDGVFARRYDASGAPRGAEFAVNTYTTRQQFGPRVASDAAGNFVIVWVSAAQYETGYGIFAQRYDASGTPRGSEFRVHTYTTNHQQSPSVAADAAGNFVVAWASRVVDAGSWGIFAQRYDASGSPQGAEFQVNTYQTGYQQFPDVAVSATGDFVIAWSSYVQDLRTEGVFAQLYDASGVPRGSEFQVNMYTAGSHAHMPSVAWLTAGSFLVAWGEVGSAWGIFARHYDASGTPRGAEFRVTGSLGGPSVTSDGGGSFVVVWDREAQNGSAFDVFARRYDASGAPQGPEFQLNTYTTDWQFGPAVAAVSGGEFVVTWTSRRNQDGSGWGVFGQRVGGILPAALAVDSASSPGSDGNGVFEPGESVDVKPSWRNLTGVTQAFDGNGVTFTGPAASGNDYQLLDGIAAYGTVADGATVTCSDCYRVGVTFGGARPSLHWDASFAEQLTDVLGLTKPWPIHVGESFTDVPRTSPYYRDIETLLHKGVTGGCAATAYCPASGVTREQMSVFTLEGREGAGYRPAACTTPMFADVPASSFFCGWIEELARRGVVGGCGGGNYCPSAAVTREQLPVFVLRLLDPTLDPPACTTPVFADVPASSPFCRWIEELARRGVVGGCGGGNYCPTSPVTREQMAVFITGTYGLSLYGP